MEHKYENQIKCPYCDWEDNDSWEFSEDSGVQVCGGCEKEFNVTRNVEVTYSTSRINCEEDGKEHDYREHEYHLFKRDYNAGEWINLPENKWQYKRIDMCSICGDKEYITITKQEYDSSLTPLTPSVINEEQ